MEQQAEKKALTLKNLTKSSVWDIQENDIFRMWEAADKDIEMRDNMRRCVDIIRSAFMIEELPNESQPIKTKYEKQGYKVGQVKIDDNVKITWAIKKRPIMRVTDLTYENIRHISAAKLIEVLDRNFGGGWDSLSQSIKDSTMAIRNDAAQLLQTATDRLTGLNILVNFADGCLYYDINSGIRLQVNTTTGNLDYEVVT
jgi:hypothetical protein